MRKLAIAVVVAATCVRLDAQAVFPGVVEGEARNKTYHVVHYKIEVSFDEAKKSLNGKVTTTLVPFFPSLRTVVFDAGEMTFRSVTMHAKPLRFTADSEHVSIDLGRPYSFNDTLALTMEYSCTPHKGLYFVGPDSGYPKKPHEIWTQGEAEDNHYWFPCYDFPNDKATSEVVATVNDKYAMVSNGKLLSVTEDRKHHTKTWHWYEGHPHSSYLVMLAAGDYVVLKDKAGSLPLEYYVYRGEEKDARINFAETPAMIRFFDEKIGFPFAWEKYAQVCIADFMYGGMENASATTLIDDGAVYPEDKRIDRGTPTSLIAHEMAHQWWGDVVTCKDWRHLWLNESFASYFDPLYHEYSKGRDEFDYEMYHNQLAGINTDKTLGRKPIVSKDSYGANVYPRGSAVLHMLRFVLGDTLFWRSMHHYITKYQFQPVETNDLKLAIEEATGQNLYWFFDEWLYKAGYPIFDVSYRWNDTTHAVLLSVKQTQKRDSLTGVFQTPVDIWISSPSGEQTMRETILSADTTFDIPYPEKPRLVIFDKGDWLLKELNFTKSREEWSYQAEFAPNPIDRIRALEALTAKFDSTDLIPIAGRIALHDRFHGVRLEAIQALARIKADGAADKESIAKILIAAGADTVVENRSAAISQLAHYRNPGVLDAVLHALEQDSSADVRASALRSYATLDTVHGRDTALAYLDVPSYNNTIGNSALTALSRLDTVMALNAALKHVRYGEPLYARYVSLGIMSRLGKKDPRVHDEYRTLVADGNRGIRGAAVRWLGDNGNGGDISALETIASDHDNSAAESAASAVKKIKERTETKH